MNTTGLSPAPVLALTILDGKTLRAGRIALETRVVLAVRDPTTNTSHPNVVSVPTQRIPQGVFDSIARPVDRQKSSDASTEFFTESALANADTNGHSDLIFAVNSLLSSKMSLSESLERKALQYEAYARALVTGTVVHSDYSEPTAMLNVVVVVKEGADYFPQRTASYSHIFWSPISLFLETARSKNPLLLDPILNPFDYCIHGMCIKSSFNVLAAYTGEELYPFQPYD